MMSVIPMLLATVMPLRIVPNKIVYPVNEEGFLTVVLTNSDSAGATDVVSVRENWGIGGVGRPLWTNRVTLKAGEGKELEVRYPGGAERYGHEVCVSTSAGSRSEYFNVIDEWWRVSLGSGLTTAYGVVTPGIRHLLAYYGYSEKDWCDTSGLLTYQIWEKKMPGMGPFIGYGNLFTRWQMQQSSVGGNLVTARYADGEIWITPNGSMPRQTDVIRRDTEIAHRRGCRNTRFTINLMEGHPGFELARKNPEFVTCNERGQFEGLYMDAETDPEAISIPNNPKVGPWTYVEPNFFRKDCFDWAIKDLVDCVSALGEDGVYFDGRYVQRRGYDAFGRQLAKTHDVDKIIVRNMKETQKAVFKANPNAYIWSNGCDFGAEMALLDHSQSGVLRELQWMFLKHPNREDNNYRGLLDVLLNARKDVWQEGKHVKTRSKIMHCGYLWTEWDADYIRKHGEAVPMSSHVMAILAGVCAHPMSEAVPMRQYNQMMTRFSEFFWHEDNEILKDGEKLLKVDSLREIWHKGMIYVREASDFTQYTVHLVNSPEQERCDDTVQKDPPTADDVEVSTRLFAPNEVRAWIIRPSGWMPERYEPQVEEIAAKSVDGECVFAVPPFDYYSLLIIRKAKTQRKVNK